ncbi:hypothetical protein LCGC14_1168370, partial [marine sediment metagenome]
MSDPSFSDTVNTVKKSVRESTAFERDWWNRASTEARRNTLIGNVDFTDTVSHYETITENAYQQDYTAKFNQLIKTNYDSLPNSVKKTITESLISLGEMPNPSVYT